MPDGTENNHEAVSGQKYEPKTSENTLHLHYRDQSVDAIQGNNRMGSRQSFLMLKHVVYVVSIVMWNGEGMGAILDYKEHVIVILNFFFIGRPAFLAAMKVTMTDDYVRILGPFR
jgi:hypothetical protein